MPPFLKGMIQYVKNLNYIKMKSMYKISALLLLITVMPNCKKETKVPAPEPIPTVSTTAAGSMKIEFEATVGDSDLVFSTATYTNFAGNTFKIILFKYYISNIKILKAFSALLKLKNVIIIYFSNKL